MSSTPNKSSPNLPNPELPKIELPNIAIAYLAHELNSLLSQGYVQKVQELESGWLKMKVHTKAQGDQNLIITPGAVFLTQYTLPGNPGTGFAAFANKQLYNRRLQSIQAIPLERILVFEFTDYKLYVELFGSGNVILTDAQDKILLPLKQEHWSAREIKRHESYQLPPQKKSFADLSIFQQTLSASTKDIVRTLVHEFGIAPLLAEQVCFELKIPKTTSASSLSSNQIIQFQSALHRYYFTNPNAVMPRPVQVTLGTKTVLYPIDLSCIEKTVLPQPLTQILDELLAKPMLTQSQTPSNKKLLDLQFSIRGQENALTEFEKESVENKQKGEWMYAHFTELHTLMEEFCAVQKTGKKSKEIIALLKIKFPFLTDFIPETQELVLEINSGNE